MTTNLEMTTVLNTPSNKFFIRECDGTKWFYHNGTLYQVYPYRKPDSLLDFFKSMRNPDNVLKFIKGYNMTNNCHKQFIAIFMIASGLHITFHRKAFNSVYPSHFGFTDSKCLREVVIIITIFARIACSVWNDTPSDEQKKNFSEEIKISLPEIFANTSGCSDKQCYRLKKPGDNANASYEWLKLFVGCDQILIYRNYSIYYACEGFNRNLSIQFNKNQSIFVKE